MLLKIDQEFKNLIPPLMREDRTGLEVDIKQNGCEKPIVVWDRTIIDGHNRYDICTANNIPFKITEMHFNDRNDAKIWMIDHQIEEWNKSGRKPTSYVRTALALQKESIYAEKAKQNKVFAMGVARKENPNNIKEQFPENSTTTVSPKETPPTPENSTKLEISEPPQEKPIQKTSIAEQPKENQIPKPIVKPTPKIVPIETRKEIAKIAQVSDNTVTRVKKIEEKATPEVKAELAAGTKSINEVYKEIKKEERKEEIQEARKQQQINKPTELQKTDFEVILADPPWRYDFSSTENREIENQYPTMDIEDICNLKIPAAKDCILFLWATAPKLREAFKVIDSWGFIYKTHAIWDKQKIGMGYYFRGQHELLLIATKGNPGTPDPSVRPSSIISEARTTHSTKPQIVYDIIEKMYPDRDYLEMFARTKHNDKWNIWGNQV